MTPPKHLNAVTLRLILIATIMLLIAGGVGLFVFGRDQLVAYAAEVSAVTAEAEKSNGTLSRLRTTERTLMVQKDTVQKASDIVAESKQYLYQNRIIDDLRGYAERAGVTIQSMTFQEKKVPTPASSASASASPAPASPSASSAAPPSPSPAQSPLAGRRPTTAIPKTAPLSTMPVTITFKNPVNYVNMLNFIHALEMNLSKMQITSINLSRTVDVQNGNTQAVSVSAITVEVYVK